MTFTFSTPMVSHFEDRKIYYSSYVHIGLLQNLFMLVLVEYVAFPHIDSVFDFSEEAQSNLRLHASMIWQFG